MTGKKIIYIKKTIYINNKIPTTNDNQKTCLSSNKTPLYTKVHNILKESDNFNKNSKVDKVNCTVPTKISPTCVDNIINDSLSYNDVIKLCKLPPSISENCFSNKIVL